MEVERETFLKNSAEDTITLMYETDEMMLTPPAMPPHEINEDDGDADDFEELDGDTATRRQLGSRAHLLLAANYSVETGFAKRTDAMQTIDEAVRDSMERTDLASNIVIVHGAAGTGKTALLGQYAHEFSSSDDFFVFYHSFGPFTGSYWLQDCLYRLCTALSRRMAVEADTIDSWDPVPLSHDVEELQRSAAKMLASICNSPRTRFALVVVDGLDMCMDPLPLGWIPSEVKDGCAILASITTGTGTGDALMDSIEAMANPGWILLELQALTRIEQQTVIRGVFTAEFFDVPDEVRVPTLFFSSVMQNAEAANASYLRLFGRYMRFAAERHLLIDSRDLPESCEEIFDLVLAELYAHYSRQVVDTTLSVLALAREGMFSHELLYIVKSALAVQRRRTEDATAAAAAATAASGRSRRPRAKPQAAAPKIKLTSRTWNKLLGDLGVLLLDTACTETLCLASRMLRTLICTRFFSDTKFERELHDLICRGYLFLVDPLGTMTFEGSTSARALMNVIYHQLLAGWSSSLQLLDTLGNLRFVNSCIRVGVLDELIQFFKIASGFRDVRIDAISAVPYFDHLWSSSLQGVFDFVAHNRFALANSSRTVHDLAIHYDSLPFVQAQAVHMGASRTGELTAGDMAAMEWHPEDEIDDPYAMAGEEEEEDLENRCLLSFYGHRTDTILCVSVSHTGAYAASGGKSLKSDRGMLAVWDTTSGLGIHKFRLDTAVVSCAFLADSSHVVCCTSEDIYVCDFYSNRVIGSLIGSGSMYYSIQTSFVNRFMLSFSQTGATLHRVSIPERNAQCAFDLISSWDPHGETQFGTFTRCSKFLLTIGRDVEQSVSLRVWALGQGVAQEGEPIVLQDEEPMPLTSMPLPPILPSHAIAVSGRKNKLAVISNFNSLVLVSWKSVSVAARFSLRDNVVDEDSGFMVFSPDDLVLFIALPMAMGTQRIVGIDVATGSSLVMLGGHNTPILAVTSYAVFGGSHASLTGRFISASDRTAKVWRPNVHRFAAQMRAHKARVTNLVTASRVGVTISSGTDGIINLWDAANGNHIKSLRGHNAGEGIRVFLSPSQVLMISHQPDGTILMCTAPAHRRPPFVFAFVSNCFSRVAAFLRTQGTSRAAIGSRPSSSRPSIRASSRWPGLAIAVRFSFRVFLFFAWEFSIYIEFLNFWVNSKLIPKFGKFCKFLTFALVQNFPRF